MEPFRLRACSWTHQALCTVQRVRVETGGVAMDMAAGPYSSSRRAANFERGPVPGTTQFFTRSKAGVTVRIHELLLSRIHLRGSYMARLLKAVLRIAAISESAAERYSA